MRIVKQRQRFLGWREQCLLAVGVLCLQDAFGIIIMVVICSSMQTKPPNMNAELIGKRMQERLSDAGRNGVMVMLFLGLCRVTLCCVVLCW